MENKGINTLIILTVFILLSGALIGLFKLWEKQDAKTAVDAQAYENCVMKEYNTTPPAYYQMNGEYPVCR